MAAAFYKHKLWLLVSLGIIMTMLFQQVWGYRLTDDTFVQLPEPINQPFQSFPCNFKITEDSINELTRLIIDEQRNLIFMDLHLTRASLLQETDKDYFEILNISRWIWVTKEQGLPLLGKDFRIEALSLGTWNYDIGHATVEIFNSSECSDSYQFPLEFKKDQLKGYLTDALLEITNNDSLGDSRICYQRLAKINKSDTYHIEPECCKIKNMNSCGLFKPEDTSIGIQILFVVMFLVCPLLLIQIIPDTREVYRIRQNGQLLRRKTITPTVIKRGNSRTSIIAKYEEVEYVHIPKYAAELHHSMATEKQKPHTKVNADQAPLATFELEDDETQATYLYTMGSYDNHSLENGTQKLHTDINGIEYISEKNTRKVPLTRQYEIEEREQPAAVITEDQSKSQKDGLDMDYIPLNSETEVRITRPLHYLLLFNYDNVYTNAIRRMIFFLIIYPSVVIIQIIVSNLQYGEFISFLKQVEIEMNITRQLDSFYSYDHVFVGSFSTDSLYSGELILLYGYIIASCILSAGPPLRFLIKRLMTGDAYLGYMKLPPELQAPRTYEKGLKKLKHKMFHRTSLIAEPKFWIFWLKELFNTLKCTNTCNGCTFKCTLNRFLKFFLCLLCPISLIPMVNCLPWDVLMKFFRNPEESETKKIIRKYGTKHLFLTISIFVSTLILMWGTISALTIFSESCFIITQIIIYTLQGTVKNYLQILPIISIVLAGIHFLARTLGDIESKYTMYKKMIFDECMKVDAQIRENFSQGEVLQKKYPLVIRRKDGIPMIPKYLYEQILRKLFPLASNELAVLCKLLVTAAFLYLVATTISVFNVNAISDLGQALATLIAATIPNVVVSISGRNIIADDCNTYKVRATIKELYHTKEIYDDDGSNEDDDGKNNVEDDDVELKLLDPPNNLVLPDSIIESGL